MIIDAHAHACGEFADLEQLIKILDKSGVDKVALCPGLKGHTTAPPLPNIPISAIKQHPLYSQYFINPGIRFNYNFLLKEKQDGNEFVYSLFQACPDRIIQIYWLDPRKTNFMTILESDLNKWHFKGIKLHQVCTPFKNDSPEIDQVVSFIDEKQIPIFIHLSSKKEAVKIMKLAANYPHTNFILLHLIGLETVAEYASQFRNIYYEISAYSYISEKRVKYAVDNFGADHVILGSDTPWDKNALGNNIMRIKRLAIPDIQKEYILGRNIANILSI